MGLLANPLLSQVIKRDASVQGFKLEKIESALLRAGRASGEFDAAQAQLLSQLVLLHLSNAEQTRMPQIEQIQDTVESVLYAANFRKTLRAYIIYREQHSKLRTDRKTLVDVESAMNEYRAY